MPITYSVSKIETRLGWTITATDGDFIYSEYCDVEPTVTDEFKAKVEAIRSNGGKL